MTARFQLISFKLCPLVQRSVITLLYKGIDFETTFIELSDPPPWFAALSPLGKVPVLRVDGETALFESAVINEYLDEVTPGRLLPEDPLPRAQARAWIEFGAACLWHCFEITVAETAAKLDEVCAELGKKLTHLEGNLDTGPYFQGEAFSLVDATYGPLFMRLAYFAEVAQIYSAEDLPKVSRWSAALLAEPAVKASVVPQFRELMAALIRMRRGHLASLLPGGADDGEGERQIY
jgi:glutathione S-transferase